MPAIEREETAEEEFVADGVVSEELKEILLGVGRFALYREDLSRGSEGAEVRRLQTRLNLSLIHIWGAHEARARWAKQREVSPMSKGTLQAARRSRVTIANCG